MCMSTKRLTKRRIRPTFPGKTEPFCCYAPRADGKAGAPLSTGSLYAIRASLKTCSAGRLAEFAHQAVLAEAYQSLLARSPCQFEALTT